MKPVGPDTGPATTASACAVVAAFYEAGNARDYDALSAVCAQDIVVAYADADVVGLDNLRAYWVGVHHYFPGIRVEWTVPVAASPDCVACEYRIFVPPNANWLIEGRGCEVFDIEGGRITRVRSYFVQTKDASIAEAQVAPGETITLAQEQAAVRRVASLVARDPDPAAVFDAITEEVGTILEADATSLFRFFADDTMELVSAWSPDDAAFPLGDRRPMNAPMLELRQDASVQRFPVLPEGSSFLEEAREYGVKSAIGVPLLVEDVVWGVVFGTSRGSEPFAPDAESRVLRFTALAGILLSHARAQEALAASRARVLAAGDESRRRVQRDLHDGAQQRLVHTIIELRMARSAVATHECSGAAAIEEALRQAHMANDELRDLVRGIMPAALTRHGLRVALDAFTEDLPLDARLDVEEGRLPGPVETAAYFVIAEAVTNVVKHAGVDRVDVEARLRDGGLAIRVRDEGTGGADPTGGTGLRGLADRLDASSGRLHVESPAGGGTTVDAWLPVRPA